MATFFKSLFAILMAIIASIVILCVAVVTIIYIGVGALTPAAEEIKCGTLLEINMSEVITDSPRIMPIANLRELSLDSAPSLSLLETLRALESAAEDPNITALSLRMDGMESLGLAMAEELRSAIELFKKSSGKPVYSYSQEYSQANYYLASIADSIYVHPLGGIEWQGIATASYYYGDLLKRLDIGVEAFRPAACKYKSAVEPYTRGSQSDESREQSQRLVDELWRGVAGQVSNARDIDPAELRRLAAEEILIDAKVAMQSSMVDGIAYRDEYDLALERTGIIRNKKGVLRRTTLAKYAYANSLSANSALELTGVNKVAIIYVDGVIVDGQSVNGSTQLVGSSTVVSQLRRASIDDDIKTVILRVNSPGGSAMAADVMWREVALLCEKKPVIVSMGSAAASGGYYVSVPSDIIVANRYTLTGSIGVYGLMTDYAGTLSNNLLINIDGAKSEPSADFGRVPRKLNGFERAAMMRSVNEIYDTFTTKVSEGRNLPIGVVMTLAGGRVWSGVEAESCGLIDGVGGLHHAISLAVDRVSLTAGDYQVVELTTEPEGVDLLLSMLGVKIRSMFASDIFPSLGVVDALPLEELKIVTSAPRGLLMHEPEKVKF